MEAGAAGRPPGLAGLHDRPMLRGAGQGASWRGRGVAAGSVPSPGGQVSGVQLWLRVQLVGAGVAGRGARVAPVAKDGGRGGTREASRRYPRQVAA